MKTFSLTKKDLFQKHGPLFSHPFSHAGLMSVNSHAILRNPPRIENYTPPPLRVNSNRQEIKSRQEHTLSEENQPPKGDLAEYLNAIISGTNPELESINKKPIVHDHIKQPKVAPKVQCRTRMQRTSSQLQIKQQPPQKILPNIVTVPAIKASILQVTRQASLPKQEAVANFDKKLDLRRPRCCSLSRMLLQKQLLDDRDRERIQDGRVKAKAIREFARELSHLRKGMAGFATINLKK